MGNNVKTGVLLAVLTAILVLFGSLFGRGGALIALIFACGMNWFSYFFSDRLVLAMYRAREVSPSEAPELHRIVERLSQIAGVPKPRIWVVPSQTPNAFATGRDPAHASVAVTEGILGLLTEEELAGVLAHEITHVKNRDILIQTVAATIAGAITFLANMVRWAALFGGARDDDRNGNLIGVFGMVLMAVLAPIAAMIVQLAISRSREYLADDGGARICGNPLFLAEALRKLAAGVSARPMAATSPATAPLFIVNPFSSRSLAALFSTHPPTEDRIRRLEQMRIG